ncbi:MAG TPA: UDP-glucose 4-epimerase GalE [Firmicutes bacterium]|nr:UDP-glucose 4-epimerase GalE [Bacillota bacterium]
MAKKTILVNGGAGYIGSHAVLQLLDHGFDVIVVDNLSNGHVKAVDPRAKLYLGDVRDLSFLAGVFKENHIDGVMQFAAKIIVPESVTDPFAYYDDNIYGVLCVVRCMKAYGVKNIVFSSTAAVYGTKKEPVISEDASLNPESPYGYAKLVSERLISYAEHAFGIKHVVFRYFNVAGASMDSRIGEAHPVESHLIPVTVKAGLTGREMTLFGDDYETRDHTCLRDYIHVVDLAEAHVLGMEHLLEGKESATINLGSQNGFTNLEIVNTVSQVLRDEKLSAGVPFKFGPRRAGDPAAIVASNKRAKEILGWTPKYNLHDMIESDIHWRLAHKNLYNDLNKPLVIDEEDRKHIATVQRVPQEQLYKDGVFSGIELFDEKRLGEINKLVK